MPYFVCACEFNSIFLRYGYSPVIISAGRCLAVFINYRAAFTIMYYLIGICRGISTHGMIYRATLVYFFPVCYIWVDLVVCQSEVNRVATILS